MTRIGSLRSASIFLADRLMKVCYDAPCVSATDTIGWTYDSNGNRLTEVRPSGTTTSTYNAADELTQASGPSGTTTYTYDDSGNQIAAGSRTYSYDLANRTVSTTNSGVTTSYAYDGDGNRLTTTTGSTATSFLWDTNNPLAQLALERDGGVGTIRTYIRGLDTITLLEDGNTYYYHHDRLGSVSALTSASGATEWTYADEPFGKARAIVQVDPSAPVNPLGYVGQYLDPASGLLDLRARQYDTETGLFTSLDPMPAGTTTPYESSYNYAGQDPINGYDLDGMRWCKLACPAVDAGLRLTALAVYTPYYAAYQANRMPEQSLGPRSRRSCPSSRFLVLRLMLESTSSSGRWEPHRRSRSSMRIHRGGRHRSTHSATLRRHISQGCTKIPRRARRRSTSRRHGRASYADISLDTSTVAVRDQRCGVRFRCRRLCRLWLSSRPDGEQFLRPGGE